MGQRALRESPRPHPEANVEPARLVVRELVVTNRAPASRVHPTRGHLEALRVVPRHEEPRARNAPREPTEPCARRVTRTCARPEHRDRIESPGTTPPRAVRRRVGPRHERRHRGECATTTLVGRKSRGRTVRRMTTRRLAARRRGDQPPDRARRRSTDTPARPRHSPPNSASVNRPASALVRRGGGVSLAKARSTSTAPARS